MKRLFTIAAVCVMAAGASAQGNMGLENWAQGGAAEAPSVWTTFNDLVPFLADSASVVKTGVAYSGNFAAKIRPVFIPLNQAYLQGTMYQVWAGTARPKSFRFAYKYQATITDDSALAAVYFYKGNIGNPGNIVGQALVWLPPASSYVYVKQDITWNNATIPDTGTIMFNTGFEDTACWLTIDDVSLSDFSAGNTNISESNMKFFQTADGNIRIEGLESWMTAVNLFDGMGRRVFSQPAKGEIAIPQLPAGVYYFEISGGTDKVTGKILIE